jgi:hypothetical protein
MPVVLHDLMWIVPVVASILALGLGTALWMHKRALTDALSEVERQFDGIALLAVSQKAYFQGLDRDWDSRWRGRGILILTREILYFRLSRRTLDLTIPVHRMEVVSMVAAGAKTARQADEFQVRYRGSDGQTRMATWRLDEARHWVDLVNGMI